MTIHAINRWPAVVLCIVVSACTYAADAPVKPSYNVYSSYETRLPGRYVLVVDGDKMGGDFKVRGQGCAFHTYPVHAQEAFRVSVTKTLEQLVAEIDVMDHPLDRTQMATAGYNGIIIVTGEELDADITLIPGFWINEMEAEVEMVAAVVVDGPTGRLLGARVSGDGEKRSDAGMACSGGADATSIAASDAMEDLMNNLGEQLTNAPRLRAAAGGGYSPTSY